MHAHAPVLEHRRGFVELAVGGVEGLTCVAGDRAQVKLEGLAVVVGKALKGQQLVDADDLVEHEAQQLVFDQGVGHGLFSRKIDPESSGKRRIQRLRRYASQSPPGTRGCPATGPR